MILEEAFAAGAARQERKRKATGSMADGDSSVINLDSDLESEPKLPKVVKTNEGSSPRAFSKSDSVVQLPQELAKEQVVQLAHNNAGTFTIAPPKFDVRASFLDKNANAIKRDPDLDLVLYKPFMNASGRKALYKYLLEELPWYRVKYTVRGTNVVTPRYTTVWGKDDSVQPLSAYRKLPRQIPLILRQLKEHIEQLTGKNFNFVLCNFYENGKDSISYHSDDESFLGPNPTIASVSLGGSRDFYLKNKADGKLVEKFVLADGDLLIMQGPTQSKWLHAIPKRAHAQPRINLTFRQAINTKGTENYYRYNVGDQSIYRFKDGKMVETATATNNDLALLSNTE